MGISRNRKPERGVTKNFERIQGETTQICLDNAKHKGITKVINSNEGGGGLLQCTVCKLSRS